MTREDWGTMEWLVENATHPGADLSLARMTVHPGKTSPPHRHPDVNEAIHVLSGHMSERLGTAWTKAGPGDTVFVSAGTPHQTRCEGTEEVIMMVAYSAGTRIYEEAKDQ